jgi:hypothetical protein
MIFVFKNNEQSGPYTEAEVQKQLIQGLFSESDFAWKEGLVDWIPLSELLSLGISKDAVINALNKIDCEHQRGVNDRKMTLVQSVKTVNNFIILKIKLLKLKFILLPVSLYAFGKKYSQAHSSGFLPNCEFSEINDIRKVIQKNQCDIEGLTGTISSMPFLLYRRVKFLLQSAILEFRLTPLFFKLGERALSANQIVNCSVEFMRVDEVRRKISEVCIEYNAIVEKIRFFKSFERLELIRRKFIKSEYHVLGFCRFKNILSRHRVLIGSLCGIIVVISLMRPAPKGKMEFNDSLRPPSAKNNSLHPPSAKNKFQRGPVIKGFQLGMTLDNFVSSLKKIDPSAKELKKLEYQPFGEVGPIGDLVYDKLLSEGENYSRLFFSTGSAPPYCWVTVIGSPKIIIKMFFDDQLVKKMFDVDGLRNRDFCQSMIDTYGIPRLEPVPNDFDKKFTWLGYYSRAEGFTIIFKEYFEFELSIDRMELDRDRGFGR